MSHSAWFSKVKGGRSPGQTMLLPQAHLPSTMLQPVRSLTAAPHSAFRFTGGPATQRRKLFHLISRLQIEITKEKERDGARKAMFYNDSSRRV